MSDYLSIRLSNLSGLSDDLSGLSGGLSGLSGGLSDGIFLFRVSNAHGVLATERIVKQGR